MTYKMKIPTCEHEPCKSCEHLKDNHLIQVDNKDIWVTTSEEDIEQKIYLKEHKIGFKCLYNGNESLNPNELQNEYCIAK